MPLQDENESFPFPPLGTYPWIAPIACSGYCDPDSPLGDECISFSTLINLHRKMQVPRRSEAAVAASAGKLQRTLGPETAAEAAARSQESSAKFLQR